MPIVFLLVTILFASADVLQKTPLTAANLKGQKHLYEEGWEIIVSPVKAWEYAEKNALSSRKAYEKAMNQLTSNTQDIALKQRWDEAKNTYYSTSQLAKSNQDSLHRSGHTLLKKSANYAQKKLIEAKEALVLGYVHYNKLTESDREELKKASSIISNTKEQMQAMDHTLKVIRDKLISDSEVNWSKHFHHGVVEFKKQYEKSGTRSNSLMANWDILVGYVKSLFSFSKPVGETVKKSAGQVGYYVPAAFLKSMIIGQNIIYSTGSSLYYSSKLGFRLISPSLEAGYLSAVSLVTLASGSLGSAGLHSIGVINRVALESAAPAVAGGHYAVSKIGDITSYAGNYLTYGGLGVSEVVIEKIESGVVLGYSALSQIPIQTLLTAVNSTIFLVYEGPKVFLVGVEGLDAPSGIVMDMKKLNEYGFKMQKLEVSPEIMKEILKYGGQND